MERGWLTGGWRGQRVLRLTSTIPDHPVHRSAPQAPQRVGWIRSVNATARTATVVWRDDGSATELSVYQLQLHPDFEFQMGDVVLRLPPPGEAAGHGAPQAAAGEAPGREGPPPAAAHGDAAAADAAPAAAGARLATEDSAAEGGGEAGEDAAAFKLGTAARAGRGAAVKPLLYAHRVHSTQVAAATLPTVPR